jgi:predicted DNA-binding protein
MALRHIVVDMKRTTIWLSEQQIQQLTKLSKRTGIKVAELIRRFIDVGLKRETR